MFRAIQLHDMLLLAGEQFNLDLIQRYLQGRQYIFKNVTGQLVVVSTIVSLRCEAVMGSRAVRLFDSFLYE